MAWGMDFDTRTNLVDVYVRYLRRKLGEAHHRDRSPGRVPAARRLRARGSESKPVIPNGAACFPVPAA